MTLHRILVANWLAAIAVLMGAGLLAGGASSPKDSSCADSLTPSKLELKLSGDTGSAWKPRPRPLNELAQNQIARPPGRKMKQEGSVKRFRLELTQDAKATLFGAYDALFIDAVRNRWYDLLESREYASEARGHVALQFELHHDGRITDMKVAENTVSETLSLICQKSVLDPAPFEKWPREMRLKVGEDFRKLALTFYCNEPNGSVAPRVSADERPGAKESKQFREKSDAELEKRRQEAMKRREEYVAQHGGLTEQIRKAILEGKANLGMTSEQVEASWGVPKNRSRYANASRVSETWFYSGTALYFEDGKLTSCSQRE